MEDHGLFTVIRLSKLEYGVWRCGGPVSVVALSNPQREARLPLTCESSRICTQTLLEWNLYANEHLDRGAIGLMLDP